MNSVLASETWGSAENELTCSSCSFLPRREEDMEGVGGAHFFSEVSRVSVDQCEGIAQRFEI